MIKNQHNVISLSELLQQPNGECDFYSMVKDFSCQLNPDVENFLTHTDDDSMLKYMTMISAYQ